MTNKKEITLSKNEQESSIKKKLEDKQDDKQNEDQEEEDEVEEDEEEEEEDEEEDEEEEQDEEQEEDDEQRIPIDLSQNEIYRGVCTLFEDDEGNNILEYISLLHTELIGINKSLENLRLIRKDITRLADCAENFLKGKKDKVDITEVAEVSKVHKKKEKVSK